MRRTSSPHLSPSDAKIVRLVWESHGVARSDLARLLDISPAGARANAKRLVNAGVLREDIVGHSRGGRKPKLLGVKHDLAFALAHHLSNETLNSAVVDFRGELHATRETSFDYQSNFLDHIKQVEDKLLSGNPHLKIIGSAIACDNFARSLCEELAHHRTHWVFTPAECLFWSAKSKSVRDTKGHKIVLDMEEDAGGYLLVEGNTGMSIDLEPFEPPRWASDEIHLEQIIHETSVEMRSELDRYLADDGDAVDALRQAVRDGEFSSLRLLKQLHDEMTEFISKVIRTFSPTEVIVSLSRNIVLLPLFNAQEFEMELQWHLPRKLLTNTKIVILSPDEWSRVRGAGLACIRQWLKKTESTL